MSVALKMHYDGISAPLGAPRLRLLSLGAGVQSTTLALMAARGDIGPMPDAAIFSDTQAEPGYVYEHLDWLESVLPFPIYRVGIGSLEEALLNGVNSTGQRYLPIPAFILNKEGATALTRRQCTSEYKIEVIEQETRRLLGLPKGRSVRHWLRLRRDEPTPLLVETWIGISTDEIVRLTRSQTSYIYKRHPLIEARMSRRDCLNWLADRQYKIPNKSACVFCPFKDNEAWADLKTNHPAEFDRAVRVDQAIRHGNPSKWLEGDVVALHRSLKPLEDIDFSAPQPDAHLFDFSNDCSGMCGS